VCATGNRNSNKGLYVEVPQVFNFHWQLSLVFCHYSARNQWKTIICLIDRHIDNQSMNCLDYAQLCLCLTEVGELELELLYREAC